MVILRVKDNFGNQDTLDILQEAELLCDVSAIEAGEIGSVFGISSQEFMLPGTDKNNKFFNNAFDIGTSPSVALNHTIFASVLVDGQEIFSGKMYINDILKDDKGYVMYKVVVINETVDFKTRIEDLPMRELDLSSLSHTLNYGAITSSWDGNLAGGDVVYPLIDYGTAQTSSIANGPSGDATFNNEDHPLTVEDFKPGIKVKAIIDSIFDQVNYSYSSSFIDSDYFDKIFMLSTPDEERGIPGIDPALTKFYASFEGRPSQSIANGAADTTIIFPNESFDNGSNYNPATGEYTIPTAGTYTFNTQLELTWASAPSILYLRSSLVKVKVNGVTKRAQGVLSANTTAFSAIQYTGQFQAGDVVTITADNKTVFRITPGIVNPLVGVAMSVGDTGTTAAFTGQSSKTLATGGTVDLSVMFPPELTVSDFLTAIIQRFNLVVEPKKNERNTLIMEPFNYWRDSGENKNWSDKVDHSVRKTIKGTMVNQARFISFKDAEDQDYLNEFTQNNYKKVFGEKLYESNSDLTEGTKELSNEFFSPTPVIAIDGTNSDVIPALYTVEGNETKKPIAFNPRLLHFNGKKQIQDLESYDRNGSRFGSGYWLEDDSGVAQLQIYYGQFHYLEIPAGLNIIFPENNVSKDLNWNNSDQFHFISEVYTPTSYFTKRDAIYEYWSEYLNHLYHPDTKTLTCNILFTPDELSNIQLNDKIFIDGHYYRINNIKSFNLTSEQSTEVELITAPQRNFRFPVRRIYNIEGPDTGVTGSNGNDLGGQFDDVTLDDDSISDDGTGIYVNVDDGLAATGSGNQLLVGKAAGLDGFTYYPNLSASVDIVDVSPQDLAGTRRNVNLGNNDIAFNAYHVNVMGNGNVVNPGVKESTVVGSNNFINNSVPVKNLHIYGNNNIISSSVNDLHVFNVNDQTYTDISESVLLQPTLDVENYESGRVVVGNLSRQGQQYEAYKVLEAGPGQTYNLADGESGYFHYHLTYTASANGTTDVYLPEAALSSSKDLQFRFTTDGTLTGSKKIRILPTGSDTIDDGAEKELTTTYDGLTVQNIEGEWIVIQEKKK